MDDKKKPEKKQKTKRRYEKPSIVYEEKIEALAGACGSITTEKVTFMVDNPAYGTPCESLHS
jgi:hypothetical protein